MANSYVVDILLKATDAVSGPAGVAGKALGGLGTVAGGAVVAGIGAAATAMGALSVTAFNVANDVDEASDHMTAALGLTEVGAQNFEGVMKNVFKNNFGQGFDDIAESLVTVEQQFKRLGGTDGVGELQQVTEAALALRDTFEFDVAGSTNSAVTLMEQFGLTAEEAFDFITAGTQRGLNSSDDFLDTIGEYSNQFANAGFTADEFFSILETGSQGGVLGTDKIADAMKEMLIILNEGGDDVSGAFDAIGLNFEQIQGFIASGDETWADYFDQIIGGLNSIEDPILRSQAQVAIFGTMAEDLGPSFTEHLDPAITKIGEFAGATEGLNAKYDNLGSAVEGYKRRALLALEPVGEMLLGFANDAMPVVDQAFTWFEENVPALIESGVTAAGELVDWFTEHLGGNTEQVQEILTLAADFWDQHGEAIMQIVRNLGEVVSAIFTGFTSNVLDIVQLTLQVLTGDWEGAGETLKNLWANTWDTVETVATAALDSILAIIGSFIPSFKVRGEDLMNGLKDGLSAVWESIKNWFRNLSWPSLPKIPMPEVPSWVPGFASGTPYSPGGLALVGERGPELVALPRGSQVFDANRTRAMAMGLGGDTYVTMYVQGNGAMDTARQMEDRLLSLQRRRGQA